MSPKTSSEALEPMHTENAPQYLSFQLQNGIYALEIECILEIRAVGTITPLPGAPKFVRGITNLRGALVPVIDLRVRLGLPVPEALSRFAVTIITKVQGKTIGLLADGVNEVLSIPTSSLQAAGTLVEHGENKFIQTLALLPNNNASAAADSRQLVVILNLDRLYDVALDNVTGTHPALGQIPMENDNLQKDMSKVDPITNVPEDDSVSSEPLITLHRNVTGPIPDQQYSKAETQP